jgi:geranylgeranyl pyrophosphate synthase
VSPELFLSESRERVNEALSKLLPDASAAPAPLHAAMRYAVLSGGKRLRPALAYGAALACGGEPEQVSPVACAVELVHAYSLVHDDLPAMDDDDERRGRPAVHVQFGEANGILAGDALLAAAFGALACPGVPIDVIGRLADAAGSRQLVGGQADDLGLELETATRDEIIGIHERKTAALFRFAVWGGGRVAGASEEQLELLERFGQRFGLAFQALDDLRDADVSECSLLLVLSEAELRERIQSHVDGALAALAPFGEAAAALRALGEMPAGRVS